MLPADGLFLLPWCWEQRGFPLLLEGAGTISLVVSLGLGTFPVPPHLQTRLYCESHLTYLRMISERILQIGNFSREVGKSHIPDFIAPFVFCRVSWKQGSPLSSSVCVPSLLGPCLLLRRLLKIFIKNRPFHSFCCISLQRRKLSSTEGCCAPPLT